MNKIKDIQLLHDYRIGKYLKVNGYKIKYGETELILYIDSRQCCCENIGEITSADNLNDFIGAEVNKITTTDTKYFTRKIVEKLNYECNDSVNDCAFITIETDRGPLQFAVYNSHNGYYGHDIGYVINGVKTEIEYRKDWKDAKKFIQIL